MDTSFELPNWKEQLDTFIHSQHQDKDGLLAIFYRCEETHEAIGPVANYVADQKAYAGRLAAIYRDLYQARFSQVPPERPKEERENIVWLDDPETRKQAVREAAMALAEPGTEIAAKDVFHRLEEQDRLLVAKNPIPSIATILYGFKEEFEKVKGKTGIFRRRQKVSFDDLAKRN